MDKMKKDTETMLQRFLTEFDEKKLNSVLELELKKIKSQKTLTILCDDKVHAIPEKILVGTVFTMNKKNLNTSDEAALDKDLVQISKKLTKVLKSNDWKEVRVVYTGHAILGALAKYLVYRICHLESTDIIYFGSSGYLEYSFRLREDI